MNCIELEITAHAPLAIGRQKPGGSISETESYIPGTMIRGAIASQILKVSGRQTANLSTNGGQFQALFLGEQPAIFQNAYPAIAKISESESRCVSELIYVLPATAVSSKAEPGFKTESKEKGGVFDTLIDRFCAEQCGHVYDPSCPKDASRIEPFAGFYSKAAREKYPYRTHSVSSRFLTRVGINRRRATAQDDILYSIEVLNESFLSNTRDRFPKWEYVSYRSQIWIDDDQLATALRNYLQKHCDSFRMGGSASRGLGKVHLAIKDGQTVESVEKRIATFNSKLKERWNLWSVFRPSSDQSLPQRTFFTLDLQSDAILTDNWQSTIVLSAPMLQDFANFQDSTLRLETSYSSYDYRAGWNAAWGLMKDMELTTNRGSVFLFSTEQPEQWYEALQELEWRGIGDRTSEGFGQVQVCNEFHTVFRENAV
ncbi:MAG: CRISPR-associated RAMP protein Csx10 [Leptolyngbyaceae cyanobacterium SU_3_3]|nr:CRISPR-associated RAMP protein Csx10 [Leptolyngbyaceae cyanobacterium SU_3_3]NJR49873.1 CRISPR-associated RAMP protein Csx10 [Leptolyngbyaceae cyanobacterium CSU_1_3]